MEAETELKFIKDVLKVLSDYDIETSLCWGFTDDKLELFINCNDRFWWAAGDSEEITPENLPILEQALKNVKALSNFTFYGADLFCCRVRGMRPQGAAYPERRELWPLFDACGPERETGMGNPYKPGQYKRYNETKEKTESEAKEPS